MGQSGGSGHSQSDNDGPNANSAHAGAPTLAGSLNTKPNR